LKKKKLGGMCHSPQTPGHYFKARGGRGRCYGGIGFVPDAQDGQGPLKAHLTEQLLRVKPFIPAGPFNRSLRALASNEPKAASVLADDRTPVAPSAVQTRSLTLGQALLADCGATWYGTIRLDDSEAVTHFRDYVDFEP
jgi:hypothetical protein